MKQMSLGLNITSPLIINKSFVTLVINITY